MPDAPYKMRGWFQEAEEGYAPPEDSGIEACNECCRNQNIEESLASPIPSIRQLVNDNFTINLQPILKVTGKWLKLKIPDQLGMKPADSLSKLPMQETSQLSAAVELPKTATNGSNKLKSIQAELDHLLIEKKKADFSLAEIEFSIYNFEGSYLKETHNGKGNLLRGFFGKVPKSALDKNDLKKFEVREEDRIFSRSSWVKLHFLCIEYVQCVSPSLTNHKMYIFVKGDL
ncbi:12077_t:CDS:2 [Ambispora gerdemannii]|uniref:Chromatin modification-related protein EAF6 n=1 Tax=Ambispora gerdemannii TaxID=144530 RepID=A0A9N9A659_9GLOM|nr:12077_t:CDS:2 [Ambispora gerdemannii]